MADVLAKMVNDLERKVEVMKVEITSINNLINSHKTQIAEANEKMSIPDEFEPFRAKVKEAFNEMADRQNSLVEKMNQHQAEIDGISNHFSFVQSQRDKDKSDLEDLSIEFSSYKTAMTLKIAAIEKSLSESLKSMREDWQKLSTAVVSQVSEAPQSIIQSNDQLLKKVEMACLDGANAMLKLGNLETQALILSRRLENLDIRLKKMELTHANV